MADWDEIKAADQQETGSRFVDTKQKRRSYLMNTAIEISEEHEQQYKDEGYFILENAIPEHLLELLRGECQDFIDLVERPNG